MSDLDASTLLNTMGSILLAILIFALGMVPMGALALFAAWLTCAKDRTHFFERKMPAHNTFVAFTLIFGIAHIVTTFIMAMTMGVDGASPLAVVTYSVATVVTIALGLSLGGCMLAGLLHLVLKKFPMGSKSGELGSYQPVDTTSNEVELESGSREAEDTTEAIAKA